MTSESHTRYGSRSCRQGKSRLCRSNQSRSRRRKRCLVAESSILEVSCPKVICSDRTTFAHSNTTNCELAAGGFRMARFYCKEPELSEVGSSRFFRHTQGYDRRCHPVDLRFRARNNG